MKWRGLRSLHTASVINIKVFSCQENHLFHSPFLYPFFPFIFSSFLFLLCSFSLLPTLFFLFPLFSIFFSLFLFFFYFPPFFSIFYFHPFPLSCPVFFSLFFPFHFLFFSLFFTFLAGKISGFWTTQLCFIFGSELLLEIRIFWVWALVKW